MAGCKLAPLLAVTAALLGASLFVVVEQVASEPARSLADYMNFGPITKDFQRQVFWVRDKLEQHVSDGSPPNVRSVLKLAADLAEQVASGEKSQLKDVLGVKKYERSQIDELWDFLDTLMDLSSIERRILDCSAYRVHRYFGIFKTLVDAKDPGSKLMRYLKHYARLRSSRCLARLSWSAGKLAMNDDFRKIERQFDHVISSGNHQVSNNTIKLIELAKGIDFAKGQYNAGEMSKFVAKSNKGHLMEFIIGTCQEFRAMVEQICDNYNFARLFVDPRRMQRLEFTQRFIKMNEYSRICLSSLPVASTDEAHDAAKSKFAGLTNFFGRCFGANEKCP